jgi:hypothetical protein
MAIIQHAHDECLSQIKAEINGYEYGIDWEDEY